MRNLCSLAKFRVKEPLNTSHMHPTLVVLNKILKLICSFCTVIRLASILHDHSFLLLFTNVRGVEGLENLNS